MGAEKVITAIPCNHSENNVAHLGQPCVRDIMTRDPNSVLPTTPVTEAAALMCQHNTGAVLVQDAAEIVGILTERDLLRATAAGNNRNGATVASLMTPLPITVAAEASWTTAAELMVRHRVRHLPVNDHGRLAGILSMRDLLEHKSRWLEGLVEQRTTELEERDRQTQYHMEVAGRIQRQLLPVFPPQLPAVAFALAYHPLDRVSGDYYDFAMLPSGRLGILVTMAQTRHEDHLRRTTSC